MPSRHWIAPLVLLAMTACSPTDQNNSDSSNNASAGADMKTATSEDMRPPSADMKQPTADMKAAENNQAQNNATTCEDVTVYLDEDGDGYGVEGTTETQCLNASAEPEGTYARAAGDCADDDPLQHAGADGVCGDWVDDDCDGEDEACPDSMPNQMNVPDWDCTGDPPENVYAWARFEDGNGYFKAGGCFVFFEGTPDVFYAQRVNIERAVDCPAGNDSLNGCTCPTTGQFPAYDRRMYAFTRRGDTPDCPDITLDDKKIDGGQRWETQPVSNQCRKYLYQMHYYDIPYSHIAMSLESLERRLTEFNVVEISCLEDILAPTLSLPHTDLVEMPIVKNESFQKM